MKKHILISVLIIFCLYPSSIKGYVHSYEEGIENNISFGLGWGIFGDSFSNMDIEEYPNEDGNIEEAYLHFGENDTGLIYLGIETQFHKYFSLFTNISAGFSSVKVSKTFQASDAIFGSAESKDRFFAEINVDTILRMYLINNYTWIGVGTGITFWPTNIRSSFEDIDDEFTDWYLAGIWEVGISIPTKKEGFSVEIINTGNIKYSMADNFDFQYISWWDLKIGFAWEL